VLPKHKVTHYVLPVLWITSRFHILDLYTAHYTLVHIFAVHIFAKY